MRLLGEYIDRLRELRQTDFEEYLENDLIHRTVERLLQISIQACLDVGRYLIAKEGFRFPEENRQVFLVLREQDVITQDLLVELEDMAGFRNILVHEYAEIEQRQVYDNLKDNLDDFERFGQAIMEYVNRSDESETKDRTAREPRARYTVRKRKPAKRYARK